MLAVMIVVTWIVGGFYYGFASELYQLVINSFTTVVTFLMVFLIQGAQNRDTSAINLKLDEIIRSLDTASDTLIDIEHDTDEHLEQARRYVQAQKRDSQRAT